MEDKTLDGLIELLRKSVISAEDMIATWEQEEYTSPELRATIEKANLILKELDQNKALLKE